MADRSDYSDEISKALDEAERLSSHGLLTEREAQCYALRVLHDVPRDVAAEELGITKSRVDAARSAALAKMEEAWLTLHEVGDIGIEKAVESMDGVDAEMAKNIDISF